MKKIALVLALMMSLSLFAGCGAASSSSPAPSSSSSSAPAASLPEDLNEVMDKVYEGIAQDEMPMMPDAETLKEIYPDSQEEGDRYRRVTEETSETDLGVARSAYKEALVSESMMGSMAYEVAVVRAESAEAASKLAEDIKANVNPRKWICVEADTVAVETIDDVVLLVMVGADFQELGDKLIANFKALAA